MRVVFMGSPDFAVPSLAALQEAYDVAGVVTQPDRPKGRGRKLEQSAVKTWATAHGLPVTQPVSLRDAEAVAVLQGWNPDLIIVAAYGQILRPNLLALPRLGCVNLHGSLLPRWRGAAPIQAAILAGDQVTGVSLMVMDEGMDSGPVLAQEATPIKAGDTGASLSDRLAGLAAGLLLSNLPAFVSGELKGVAQDPDGVTRAPLLKKEDGRLNPAKEAAFLERQVRAYDPWPGTFIEWEGGRLNVHQVEVLEGAAPAAPGRVVMAGNHTPAIQTGAGQLILTVVQPAGRGRMSGRDFLNGAPEFIGATVLPGSTHLP
jgi:methionyl-tRNA formyltransferase